MKLSLILLSCLVGLACAQRYGVWPVQYNQRALYYPGLYGNNFYHPFALESYDVEGEAPIQARTPLSNYDPAARFFFGNLLSLTSASLQIYSTITSTVYKTVASAALSATTINCIGNALLAAQANAASTCRRKRDSGILEVLEAFENDRPLPGSFFAKQEVIPSALSEMKQKRETRPEIESSQDNEPQTFIRDDLVYRKDRGLLSVLTTVTSTLTSFSFSTTTLTKTLTANFAADAQVTCVPSGYAIC